MEITIQAIHFEASKQLEAFIQKKASRLSKFHDGVYLADVSLKVIKPETSENKEASIKLFTRGHDFFAEEIADTFEEAIDKCVNKLERQVVKFKEKRILKK
ncbi:MAG: ribosome-associated translation inhibitor RaiA [Dysgonamonadaceae bacterium]|jgi:putative sigma-54 modulation protein|nr:ribosome-associated translation inhibitor RaiA [Dysgonamonadaceae bacterium]